MTGLESAPCTEGPPVGGPFQPELGKNPRGRVRYERGQHHGQHTAGFHKIIEHLVEAGSLPGIFCQLEWLGLLDIEVRAVIDLLTLRDYAYVAKLPLRTLDLPIFAFANFFYALPKPESLARLPGEPNAVREVCISALLRTAGPMDLSNAKVVATAKVNALIDDFSHGLRDWYQLNAGNLTHQQSWTLKFTDPMYRGADGAKLKLTLIMPSTNRLTFVMNENEWRSYRGPRKTFVCERAIPGSDAVQTVILEARDFSADGGPLKSWAQIDQLGICPYNPERRDPANPPPPWNGAAAMFV